MRLTHAWLLLTGLVPCTAGAQLSAPSPDTTRTLVTATGSARVSLTPDRATITILVEPQAMSAEEAGNRLASVERAVLDTLRHFNLPAGSMSTVNSGVTPYRSNMSVSAGGPSFAGRTSIRVELTRLDMISAITGAALAKGATYATPSAYSYSASDSVRRTLIPKAFQQARREAETLAEAAGHRLGRLVDMSVQQSNILFAEQQQAFVMANSMYDNGQRLAAATSVIVNVTTRWTVLPGSR